MATPPPPAVGNCTASDYTAVYNFVQNATTADYICATFNVAASGVTNAVLQWTVTELTDTQDALAQTRYGLNTAYILASAYQVFVMQIGFALYAAGVVRAKNVVSIFLKSFTDACIAAVIFYVVGFAFCCGAKSPVNGFIGNWDFALSATASAEPAQSFELWIWNWSFASASATILSGSIAERATFQSYIIYSIFITGWVYPVVAHWLWSPDGWLSAKNPDAILGIGAIDYSGSGVVHLVGGVASVVGSIIVGPRTGRFDGVLASNAFRGNSPSLYLMGTFLLWFGWYGFNPGSRLAIDTFLSASIVSRTATTTTLATAAGAITALMLVFWLRHTWDLLATCTGALSGLVAITAGCSVMEPWAAIICGITAAPFYVFGEMWVERLKIDDPVSAFALHGLSGMWGLIFTGLLAKEEYITQVYGTPPGHHTMGLFYGGHAQLLLCQFIAVLVITAWSGFWMVVLFGSLKLIGQLRVPLEEEAVGLDMAVCGTGTSGNTGVGGNMSKITGRMDVALTLWGPVTTSSHGGRPGNAPIGGGPMSHTPHNYLPPATIAALQEAAARMSEANGLSVFGPEPEATTSPVQSTHRGGRERDSNERIPLSGTSSLRGM